jgi:hypothetical protein
MHSITGFGRSPMFLGPICVRAKSKYDRHRRLILRLRHNTARERRRKSRIRHAK